MLSINEKMPPSSHKTAGAAASTEISLAVVIVYNS